MRQFWLFSHNVKQQENTGYVRNDCHNFEAMHKAHFSVGNSLQKGRCELQKLGHFRPGFSTSTRLLEYHKKSQLNVLILTKCRSFNEKFYKTYLLVDKSE